jgi:integrase
MAKIYKRYPETSSKRGKGGGSWWITYTQNGMQVKRSLGVKDKKTAEMIKAEIERNIEMGKVGLPQSYVDVFDLFEEFKRSVLAKKNTPWAKRMFQLLKPFLLFVQEKKQMNLARVIVVDVEDHLSNREKVVSDKTWNEELRVISRFFQFAVDREYLGRNPCRKISYKRVIKHSIEIFTPEELALIFKYAHPTAVPYYKLLLYTGLRDGEARHLQWSEVDLTPEQEHVKVRNTAVHLTKTRKDRVVPLCPEIVEVLARLRSRRDESCPFVFPGRKGGPMGHNRNTWIACLDRIEKATGKRINKGFHTTGLHLFRHTFATNCLASGIDIRTVQDWLGHSTILMTQRYTNLLPSQKQAQIQKLHVQIGGPPKKIRDSD